MYLHKWNEALVDWVNCLALTPKIIDLSELENGLFYSLLLKNVIPSGDLEIDPGVSSLDAVFSYLESEFPLYDVQDIKSEGKSKVVYISSLLLLLSVTKGKNPLYCSQLCKDLQHDSQVKIKCFLESCLAAADSLNHLFLKSIIEGDYVPVEQQCLQSPKRIPEIMRTPLKEFLESPRLTDKLSRDLRRLESEKEALQLEKMELEDDLRTEKEKREELEENLSKKSEQVIKLREELLEYAQSINELKNGDDYAIFPGRVETLESELKETKTYMKLLVEERDVLSQENGKLKDKQVSLLERMKKLEVRALDCERTNEDLQLSLSQKEQDLQEIKIHLCELKEKLQLVSTQHNASLDSDTSLSVINNVMSSPFLEGERLSQAVVDLKLAEVEADNEKLKSQLGVTQEQSQNLRAQLEEVKEKLEKAKVALEAAMTENTLKQRQLSECIEERETLNLALVKANDQIFLLSETNAYLNKDIAELKDKAVSLESHCCQLDKQISILEDDLRRKHEMQENTLSQLEKEKIALASSECKYKQLQHEMQVCINEKEEIQENTLSQLEKEKIALASSECKYKQLQHEMQVCINEKEEIQVALTKVKENNSILGSEKESLLTEISELKNKLTITDESNRCLKAESTLLIKEIDEKQKIIEKVEEELQVFENKNETLERTIADSKNVNDNLSEMLFQEKQNKLESDGTLKKLVESLEDEMQSITQMEGTECLVFSHDMIVAEKLDLLLSFFKKYHLSNRSNREDLTSKNALLDKEVQRFKESEQVILNEKANYEKQISDALVKIHNLELCVADLETNAKQLNEELAGKKNQIALSLEEKEELDALREDKKTYLESVKCKEEEINLLKHKISEEESKIKTLECEKDDLINQRNNFLGMVGELRTAIDQVSEEKLMTRVEEQDLLDWKTVCEILEAKIKELSQHKQYAVPSASTNHDLRVTSSEPTKSGENVNATREGLVNFDKITCTNDVTYTVPDRSYDEINVQTNSDTELGCQLQIDADITRKLGLENKFWQVIRSGEMLEMFTEKLEEKNIELSHKIAELWEVLPKVQLKCNEVFLTKGSADLMGREAELSKELCMQLEKMLIRMEKHKASLEQEKMHVTHRALSVVLNGIQFTFVGSSTHEDSSRTGCGKKPTLVLPDDQELEISKSLERIEDKFAIALGEVASTAKIFKEVELRCSKAEDALEYLRSHGKIEKKVMSDTTYKNNHVKEDEFKTLKASYEEIVTARLHLERICRENQDELQKFHIEKVALQEKIDHLISHNNGLRNELEICNKKIGCVREETMEDVRKEYEKKLARLKQKLESAYQEDFEKFTQESERCRQLEESCKKYKNLLLECHKNLSDMKLKHKNTQQKMEALKNKNNLLEEKLFESQLNFGLGNVNQSMSSDLNRSQSAEHLATYFARGDLGGLENVKFSSENRLYPLNSSNFSRESGRSNLPSGMGQVFCTEDEEGESFNATFLSDLKEGRCDVPHNSAATHRKTLAVLQEPNRQHKTEDHRSHAIHDTPNRRLNELMRRNTLCLPHLKSSYPAETQIQDPQNFSEDLLKGSSSLKAPLISGNHPRRLSGNIAGDLRRKKDKGQIAYMKPGPPTPGKNRRSSLQGNEQSTEPKIQSTPGRILSWFGRRRRSVWDAENIPDTPRTKQKGLSRRLAGKQGPEDP